jgi:hypothetical protein
MVDWTRPHRAISSIALCNPITGDMSSCPTEVARILANQFTATNNGTVDLTLLNELPAHATRVAVPVSSVLIREALAKNSNSSTLEPDHIS